MSDPSQTTPADTERLKLLEALLFAAPGLSSVDQLTQSLEVSKAETERLLELLSSRLQQDHGLRLQKVKHQYQLVTAAAYAPAIETFLGLEATSRLSQAALEALAIIAYKTPATRPEIDSIRGVNSDGVVKSLLTKGLIEELGRSDAPGRPILYGITPDFLQHFGLESLDQLPKLDLDELLNPVAQTEGGEQRLLKD